MKVKRLPLHLLYCLLFIQVVPVHSQYQLPSFTNPPTSAMLLSEGILSTSLNERDFALSPDGNEIYYTVSIPRSIFQTIVFRKRQKDGRWSAPEVAPFAGHFSDLEPAFTADGSTLYFASNRPLEGTQPKDFDIWKVTRTKNGWGTPEHLSNVINTEEDEFYPSITNTGNLYFTAAYKGGPGREDIYIARWRNNQFEKPEPLDSAVNTGYYEFNAFVTPDERYIFFTSYGRKDDSGGGDLYVSTKDSNNKWQQAKNLKSINSGQLDYCPSVSPDGKIFFFTSERHSLPRSFTDTRATYTVIKSLSDQTRNGTGNIYWINFETLIKFLDQ